MRSRLDLHFELCQILNSEYAYFQPPESVKLNYSCIIYELKDIDTKHADDMSYLNTKCYKITYINKDPDSEIPDKILSMPMCSFDRFYTADNLNHWVFTLYY